MRRFEISADPIDVAAWQARLADPAAGAWLAFEAGWGGVGIWTGLAVGLGIVAVLMLIRWILRSRLGLVPSVSER